MSHCLFSFTLYSHLFGKLFHLSLLLQIKKMNGTLSNYFYLPAHNSEKCDNKIAIQNARWQRNRFLSLKGFEKVCTITAQLRTFIGKVRDLNEGKKTFDKTKHKNGNHSRIFSRNFDKLPTNVFSEK